MHGYRTSFNFGFSFSSPSHVPAPLQSRSPLFPIRKFDPQNSLCTYRRICDARRNIIITGIRHDETGARDAEINVAGEENRRGCVRIDTMCVFPFAFNPIYN